MDQSQFLLDNFLPSHLGSPGQSIEFIVAQKFKAAHAELHHIVVLDATFPLSAFLKSQNVEVKVTEKYRSHHFDHSRDKLVGNLKVGFSEFSWAGTDFLVYKVTWSDPVLGLQIMYIVMFKAEGNDNAERDKVGEELITAAYKWNLGTKDEIYVFSDGHWSKDKKLWKAIQLAQWDNLVLDEEFVVGLKRDTDTFFSSREIYESLEIPWKRGLLLLGNVVLTITTNAILKYYYFN
jgi:hypothetical protein